jgi:hypothetical protein
VADAAYILDQYEALRHEATEGTTMAPRGHGLALFIGRGVSAWLTALTALAPSRPARAVDARMEPASRLLPAARVELATVLAGMVLLCTQPREESS